MRGTRGSLAGAMAVLAGSLAFTGIAHAAPAADRQQPCAEAWSMVAKESASLAAGDAGAWSRVSDGFISMSDATFDGPLSNAFGTVSSASADVATALKSDAPAEPARAAFDAALGSLGTVCSHLTVTKHTSAVARFQRFSYQSGTVAGLGADATTRANAGLALLVDRTVQAARRANGNPCMGGAKACGYFVQTLQQRPCVPGFVCLRQQSGLLPVGANDGQGTVETMALDALTGRAVRLSRVVPASARPAFLSGLNSAVRAGLAASGLGNDPYWDTTLTLKDVHAWLPQPDGIHVWFDKFAVAPGGLGIVHVVVPWPAGTPVG